MQTSLGHGHIAEGVGKSGLADRIKEIVKDAKGHVKLESQELIFEGSKKLTADDLKTPQDPEEFTKRYIIEKVFSMLDVSYEAGERHFRTTDGTRKVDYEARSKDFKFIVEAKAINADLYKNKDGAVEQIKGLFRLAEVKDNYSFGIATDGFKWIFINPSGEEIGNFSLREDFSKIKGFITGRRDVRIEKKQAEISKRFYQWYNALLHGGSYRDLKGRQRKIPKESCLVESVLNVPGEGDREEIAQVFINRLIFIKFLQGKGLIKEEVLGHLTSLSQDVLDLKLRQLFFSILNTKVDKRASPDPKFAGIPYLNGSLFTWSKPEAKNPEYRINAEVLQEVIKFLDTFRFVSEIETAEESIDPEILGYIFERAMTATDRKGTGAYYTPKYITSYICENTIYPYILGRSREYLKREKGYKDSELPSDFNDILDLRSLTLRDIYSEIVQKITVCDPACGSGAFLLASADILFDIYTKIEDSLDKEGRNLDITLKKVILRDNIYGVDINHKGIEIAKLRLWLWMADSYDPEGKIEALPNIEYNVRAGNSLVGYVDVGKFRETKVSIDDYLGLETPVMEHIKKRDELLREYKLSSGEKAAELKKQIEEAGTKIKQRLDIHLFQDMKGKKIDISPTDFTKLEAFHWGYEFHKVFENGEGGFSVVIGNPPYVRIYRGTIGSVEVDYWKKRFASAYMKFDLYVLFLEMSIDLINESGFMSMIVPDKFMNTPYGEPIRNKILEETQISSILDLRDLKIFEDATVSNVVPVVKKGAGYSSVFPVLKREGSDFVEINRISQDIFSVSHDNTFRLSRSSKDLEVLTKIKKQSIPFSKIYYANWGLRTGTKSKTEQYVVDTGDHLLAHPMIRGSSIVSRYELTEPDQYIIYDKQALYNPMFEELFENPKIVFRKISGKEGLMAIYDNQDYYCFSTLIPSVNINLISKIKRIGIPEPTHESKEYKDPFFILANVNSKLIRWYYNKNLSDKLSVVPNHIKQLPIRRINFTTPEEERTGLVSELKELYAKSNFPGIISRVESYHPKDADGNFITGKEKSDVVHDLLGFLAEQMMDLNKQKQAETKSFHAWLENYLGIKIDEMDVKTQVKAFYDRSWDEYYKVLKRSKGKLELKIESKDAHDTIKEAFDGTMSKLTPLFDRVRGTDALIDQIVYRLYGLTEEEIKVVGGEGEKG